MAMRVAILGDIHGNVAALEAALAEIKRQRPDHIAVTGDLVLNGPRPAEVIERVRKMEQDGALVVCGNTDIAVTDYDYGAAFPWLQQIPAGHRAATEWAHEQLSDDQLDWLRKLPNERRVWSDDLLTLICHGSPGSITAGLPADLDSTVTVERVTRSDARVICCGHTHLADVRELGRKLIVNPGSCGYDFGGDPGAGWALLTIPDQPPPRSDTDDDADEDADEQVTDTRAPSAQLFRASYDADAAAEEVAARGLHGDVYRAATIRTGRLIR
ncbi:MAG TPA: metallophosphoesterase family protein [Candidatus Limnocylindrales bacterium]